MAKSRKVIQNDTSAVEVEYEQRDWAVEFHANPKRFKVLVLHRRAGKTTAVINHLIRDAMLTPGARYAYIAPTYKQAKNIAWDMVKATCRSIPSVEFNEVELTVRFPTNSKITLYGADNPDSLRGIGLWGVVFDEYSQQPSNIFTEIILPALADHQGYAVWIGTPKGKNDFYRLFQQAISGVDQDGRDVSEDWWGLHLKASESGIIPDKELDLIRRNTSEDEFAQELECSFDASIKGAYYSKEIQKARTDGRIAPYNFDPLLPVFTVWDLGVADATAIGFYQKIGHQILMVDYYEASDRGLNHYIKVLREKDYIYSRHFAPHDIKQREWTTNKSRWEIARELGLYFELIPELSVEDGINAGRMVFPRLIINEKNCARFVDYLSQYHKEWDDKRGAFKDRPKHDFTSHAADVHRYMAIVEGNAADTVNQPDFNLYNQDYS
jgi:phage terminase large subunit